MLMAPSAACDKKFATSLQCCFDNFDTPSARQHEQRPTTWRRIATQNTRSISQDTRELASPVLSSIIMTGHCWFAASSRAWLTHPRFPILESSSECRQVSTNVQHLKLSHAIVLVYKCQRMRDRRVEALNVRSSLPLPAGCISYVHGSPAGV